MWGSSISKPKKGVGRAVSSTKRTSKSRKASGEGKHLELLHVALVFILVFLTLSLVSYNPDAENVSKTPDENSGILGKYGDFVASVTMLYTFGRFGSFAVPLIILMVLIKWWSKAKFKLYKPITRIVILGFYSGFVHAFWGIYKKQSVLIESVGIIPFKVAEWSSINLHLVGTVLVTIVTAMVLLVLLTKLRFTTASAFLFYQFPKFVLTYSYKGTSLIINFITSVNVPDIRPKRDDKKLEFETEPQYEESAEITFDEPTELEVPYEKKPKLEIPDPEVKLPIYDDPLPNHDGERQLPPLSLLDPIPDDRHIIEQSELDANSRSLEDKLGSLKIEASVIRTVPGPVITRYDLKPAADVKIARIANSADDIAMALRARGVRILAPIPGEAAVGVEIPNSNPATVNILEVVGSEMFRHNKNPLTIALGKDASGGIFCVDLAKMPHLLIAGATGAGKSVCINVIISSILFRADPDKVRLLLVDPKKIELSLYARLSNQHLLSPPGLGELVITGPENAVKSLQSVHMEMERRYDILAEAGVRGLEEYNDWIERTAPDNVDEADTREKLPYIVVIIDELADLMMVVKREFEELLVRLAQMARAVGIYLIVATQRPSVDVVTGLIKANFPSRIAFKVPSKVDSRTIIDSMGAETLLGKGDMLFQGPSTAGLVRLHGAFISTAEVERVVEFLKAQPSRISTFKLPDPEVARIKVDGIAEDSANIGGTDTYFEEAAKIVVRSEQGSISVLQRRLRVGYARAARLIDELEQAGIVGPFDGSKAREVIATPEDLAERFGIQL